METDNNTNFTEKNTVSMLQIPLTYPTDAMINKLDRSNTCSPSFYVITTCVFNACDL